MTQRDALLARVLEETALDDQLLKLWVILDGDSPQLVHHSLHCSRDHR